MCATSDTHRAALTQFSGFRRESARILADWDAYSDEHTGVDGWPFDEDAYGLRKSQRDRDTAAAFDPVRHVADVLLATAEEQLGRLPAQAQPRWPWQLGVLREALACLDTLQAEWEEARDTSDARPGTSAHDDALALYDAEAWSHLDCWATHGIALLEIDTAARSAPLPLARQPVAAPGPAAGRCAPGRRL